MAIPAPSRVIQIRKKLTGQSGPVLLYTPGKATIKDTIVNYQASSFMLNVCAYIRSTTYTSKPFIDPLWTSLERQTAVEAYNNTPHKGMLLYLQAIDYMYNPPIPNGEITEIGVFKLFNSTPFHQDEYKSLFGIQYGVGLFVSNYNLNAGGIDFNDYVAITGEVIETTSFLQDDEYTVYNFIEPAKVF